MSFSVSTLRLRLAQLSPSGDVHRALAMLESQDLEPSKLNPVRSTADELFRLWKTREQTSALSGLVIPGVASLNARLSKLPSNAQVEQYNFETKSTSGSIFIDPATGEFLGDTIVERRGKSQQMVELESQLFQSSRKSA
jgi:hypothetical protein